MRPERVNGLIVMNTVLHSGFQWHALAKVWGTPLLGDAFMLSLSRPFYRLGFKRDFPKVADEKIDRMYGGMNHRARKSVLRLFRRMTRPGYFDAWEARFAEVTRRVRTVVLWGEDDSLIPLADAHRIGGTVKMIADCGHWVPLEKPERVAAEVRAMSAQAPRAA
jgi:pimeloyl-ACP methyl ester carboxylesterase